MNRTLLCLALLILGLFLRSLGAVEPLWLDEVWSIRWLSELRSYLEVFTVFKSENNHFIQSLWLYFILPAENAILIRAFSYLCSTILLLLLFLESKKEKSETLFLFIIVTVSYVMTLYGTEARGYSPMLLGLYLVYRYGTSLLDECTTKNTIIFWIASLFALLSHISSATFILAMILTISIHLPMKRSAVIASVPLLTLAHLYLFVVREYPGGTGTIGNEAQAIINIFSVGFGGPDFGYGPIGILALVIAFGSAILLIKLQIVNFKAQDKRALFFLLAIFVLPATTWFIYQPRSTYARHFLPSLFAGYLLAGAVLNYFWTNNKNKIVSLSILSLFIVLNTICYSELLKFKRGDYRVVIEELLKEPGTITVDHPFRHQTMLRYYLDKEKKELRLASSDVQTELPKWATMIADSEKPFRWHLTIGDTKVEETLTVNGQIVELVKTVHATPLSGWETRIYRVKESQ